MPLKPVGGSGVALLGVHASTPVIAHSVGDYVPGLAIVFVSDTFTALMLVLTSLVAFVSSLFLVSTGEDQYRFVPALILMMLTGVYGALLTGDLFNFFVFVVFFEIFFFIIFKFILKIIKIVIE